MIIALPRALTRGKAGMFGRDMKGDEAHPSWLPSLPSTGAAVDDCHSSVLHLMMTIVQA